MNWLIFVIISVLSGAIAIFIDNYTSDYYFKGREAASQKTFYTATFVIIGLIILLCSSTNLSTTPLTLVFLFILSGILTSIAGIPYYKALEIDDSTNLGIFIQLAPILYLILGWLFLGESISVLQFLAFIIILSGPILILLTTRKHSRKTKIKAIFYAFLYVLIAIIANLIFVKENANGINFVGEIGLLYIGKGIGNIVIIIAKPKWRRRFHTVMEKSHKKVLRPLISNCLIGIAKNFAYRATLITAPSIALASAATDSAEPIAIFFMGIVLTLIWPKFGREKLNKKAVLVHLIATILVVTGVILIQI